MTASEKLNHVLQEIACATGRDPAPSGDGWFNCLCPAHNDTNPSLGIKAMDTRIILNCQAGCDEATVAAAIGMTKKDLFYESRKTSKRKNEPPPSNRPTTPLTVKALAADKCLPALLLKECGVEQDGSIVRIRYRLMDGTDAPRHRKRTGTKGTTGSYWYGTKADGKPVPYGLWRIHEAREKRALIIVEGESDCWTLWHHGFPALGIPGATADSCLKPEYFERIDKVFVFSEPDKAGQKFPARVAKRIRGFMPDMQIKSFTLADHKDPNELHQNSADGFQKTICSALNGAAAHVPASPAPPPTSAGESRPDEDAKPREVADDFCAANTMAYHNGIYYHFSGKCYRQWSDRYAEARVAAFIRDQGKGVPATNFVGNALLNIRAQTLIAPHVEPPTWLLNKQNNDYTHINVGNGVLNIDRLIQDDETAALTNHNSDFFSVNALNFKYSTRASCDRWLKFLDEVLPDDDLQGLMQEWFGYCLIPTQRYQKIMMMQGEGANGKSVVCAILKMLVGRENCAAVGLDLLADRFQTSALLGKLVCFSNELGFLSSKSEGVLKAITGGDTVEIEYKLKDKFSTTLFSRFVVTTNNAPRINDRSDGIWRRLIVVPFDVKIPEEKQIPFEAMTASLASEMPGILTWALAGLKRLQARGRFIENEKTLAIKDDYKRSSNPARTWIEENLVAIPERERWVSKKEAYQAYHKEIKELGLKPHGSPSFGVEVYRWIESKTPDFRPNKEARRRDDGRIVHVYEGLMMPVNGVQSFDDTGAL